MEMRARTPAIGLSAGMLHPDPTRSLFKGKRLLYAEEMLFHWVTRGGAAAFLVPSQPSSFEAVLAPLDGLLLTGGSDVAPHHYGETPLKPEWAGDPERDAYELALVRAALARGMPVLGVCRGLQLLNVALGGSLYQDISELTGTPITHRDWEIYDANVHEVEITAGSRLARLYPGVTRARVNSVHHQAIKTPAEPLLIEARCPDDGVIEAVRLADPTRYAFAVQWHPEWQDEGDGRFLHGGPILAEFLDACRAHAGASGCRPGAEVS